MADLPAPNDPIWYRQDKGEMYRQLFQSDKHVRNVDNERVCYLYDYSSCRQVLADSDRFAADGERALLSMTEESKEFSDKLLSFRGDSEARSIRQALKRGLDAVTLACDEVEVSFSPIRALVESPDAVSQINGFDLAFDLSLEFMSRILGIPQELWGLYRTWALNTQDVDVTSLLMRKLNSLINSRQCEAVAGNLQKQGWKPEEVSLAIKLLSRASLRTMQRSITNLLYAITQNSDLLPSVTDESVDSCVNEILRLYPPTVALARTAKVDCELDVGVSVSPGTQVIALIGAAQRDPARYDHPDEFDSGRKPQDLLAFGWGPHSCLGEKIGRSVLAGILHSLKQNGLNLTLSGKPAPMQSFSYATWTNLPLVISFAEDTRI